MFRKEARPSACVANPEMGGRASWRAVMVRPSSNFSKEKTQIRAQSPAHPHFNIDSVPQPLHIKIAHILKSRRLLIMPNDAIGVPL